MPRDPKDSQIDRYVPARVLAYLGAAKTLTGRSGWYTGKIRGITDLAVAYHIVPWVGGSFPNEATFWTVVLVFWAAVIGFEYFLMWPATIIFGNVHGEDANRSPIRQDTQEILRRLDRLDPGPNCSGDD